MHQRPDQIIGARELASLFRRERLRRRKQSLHLARRPWSEPFVTTRNPIEPCPRCLGQALTFDPFALKIDIRQWRCRQTNHEMRDLDGPARLFPGQPIGPVAEQQHGIVDMDRRTISMSGRCFPAISPLGTRRPPRPIGTYLFYTMRGADRLARQHELSAAPARCHDLDPNEPQPIAIADSPCPPLSAVARGRLLQ